MTTVCAKQQFGMKLWFCGRHDVEDNGERFIVRADEKLTAFLELESAIRRLKANYGP